MSHRALHSLPLVAAVVGCGAGVEPVATPIGAEARGAPLVNASSAAALPPAPALAASYLGAIDRELAPPPRRNGGSALASATPVSHAAKLKVEVGSVRGRYDAGAFRFAVESQSSALSDCIDAAPTDDRAATVVVELSYDGQGVLEAPRLIRSGFRNARVTACVVAALHTVNPARQTPQGDESQAHAGARLTVTLSPPPGF